MVQTIVTSNVFHLSVALVYWVVNIAIENLGRFIGRKMAISAPDNVETDVKEASLMIKISNLSKSFPGQTVLDHP